MPQRLTNEIITAAIAGFEGQKAHIDSQIAELRAMLTGSSTETPATPEAPARKRRKMSAAARKRIGDAQRKRWAASKGEAVTPEPTKPKRKMSAAGKAAIIAATKKRWAKVRAEKVAKAQSAAAKKTARRKSAVKKAAAKKTAPVVVAQAAG